MLALLLWVIVRYNRRANPTPKKFTHNMFVEVIWTIVPVLILVAIAWQSFPLIYQQERIPEAELTLKVTGNSWFWNFEYPDQGVTIAANLLPEEDARAQGRPYLLGDDRAAAGAARHHGARDRHLERRDPRLRRAGVRREGRRHPGPHQRDLVQRRVQHGRAGSIFYGQCSELCGINHAYMPIEIHAVTPRRVGAVGRRARRHARDRRNAGRAGRAERRPQPNNPPRRPQRRRAEDER